MKNRCAIAFVLTGAVMAAIDLQGAETRRSQPGGTPRSTGRSFNVQRTPNFPRRAPQAAKPPAGAAQQRALQRPAVPATPRRDWTYPRSGNVTPRAPARVPGGATPAAPRDRTGTRGGLGISGARGRDHGRESARPFINVNPSWGNTGRVDWASRSRQRPGAARGTGFGHRLDRHWDQNTRRDLARGVRGRVHVYNYFRPDWRPYRHRWVGDDRWRNYWGWRGWRPYYWWGVPAWSSLVTFVGGATWAPSAYIPYDYGDNVIYQGDAVYQNGQQIATAEQWAQQAQQLANVSVPPPPPAADATVGTDWQPLGVFSLVTDEQADPDTFLQLAISREGYISGTYYNRLADELLPVQGSVDKRTQRAAWHVGDNKDTVMEAGLYNLTQDQAPLLIHFGTGATQNYLLVRMEQPQGDVPGASATPFDAFSQ